MNKRLICWLIIVLMTSGAFVADVPARDGPREGVAVALIVELSGKIETQIGGKPVSASMLWEFGPGSRLRLYKDARALLLFYRTGERYVAKGPALIRFSEDGLDALSGDEPIRQKAVTGKDGKTIAVRAAGIAQAGIVVRGGNLPILAFSPAGEVTLEASPIFRWREVEPGLEYRFVLRDLTGNVLVDQSVRGGSFEPPQHIVLGEGEHYRWSLTAKTIDGTRYSLMHKFYRADARIRADVENFRPGPNADSGERIVFAIWLEQSGLKDEALRVWGELARAGISVPPDKIDSGR